MPVIGGVTSWVLVGEGFGLLKTAGAALVLAGLVVARRRTPPHPAASPARLELAYITERE